MEEDNRTTCIYCTSSQWVDHLFYHACSKASEKGIKLDLNKEGCDKFDSIIGDKEGTYEN
jgi:hypothetical protein